MTLYSLARPFLFAMQPERAHNLAISAGGRLARLPGFQACERVAFGYEDASLRLGLWGRELANPVGLAAGFDKNGSALASLLGLGFGFVECGTVTPRPQEGNPRPRLFRLPGDRAIINRMGFNNQGAMSLARRLSKLATSHPHALIGVNLGKNRDTPLEKAGEDYLATMQAVYSGSGYLTVNVSSPNTPGLRGLQSRKELSSLLRTLCGERDRQERSGAAKLPILVKIAPDMEEAALGEVVETVLEAGCDGLIATNTTLAREHLESRFQEEEGGLSGRPLLARALKTVETLHGMTEGRLTLVGVGGIFGAEDAYAFIRAGASLVQVYTGLIYQGPGLVKKIKRGLVSLLKRDGFDSVSQAIGTGL